MKKLKQLFEKIKKYLNKLFRKEPILLLENSAQEEVSAENRNVEEDKMEFLELYEKVKNGKVSKEHLMIDDLIKVMLMMKQEKEILDNKVIEERNLIKQMNTKILELQEENKKCKTNDNV